MQDYWKYLSPATRRTLPYFAPFRGHISLPEDWLTLYAELLTEGGFPELSLDTLYDALAESTCFGLTYVRDPNWAVLAIHPVLYSYWRRHWAGKSQYTRLMSIFQEYMSGIVPQAITRWLTSKAPKAIQKGKEFMKFEMENVTHALKWSFRTQKPSMTLYDSIDLILVRSAEQVHRIDLGRELLSILGEAHHAIRDRIYASMVLAYRNLDLYDESNHYLDLLQNSTNVPSRDAGFVDRQSGVNNMMVNQFETAKFYFLSALDKYKENGDLDNYAKVFHDIGTNYAISGNLDSANEYITEATQQFKKQNMNYEYAVGLMNLGIIRMHWNDMRAAMAYLEEANPKLRRFDDQEMLGCVLHSIAEIQFKEGDFSEAEKAYKLALETVYETKDLERICHLYANLAMCAYRKKQFPEAVEYARLSVDLSPNEGKRFAGMSLLAFYESANSNFQVAIQYGKEAYQYYLECKSFRNAQIEICNLGCNYIRIKNWHEAKDSFLQGLNLHEHCENLVLQAHLTFNLGEVYQHLGMHEISYDTISLAKQYYASIGDLESVESCEHILSAHPHKPGRQL